jgi:hypothetical protein
MAIINTIPGMTRAHLLRQSEPEEAVVIMTGLRAAY